MKPLFLEIQAFGPYVEKQTVDFEKLGQKGIFLIKGNTGSGKTTIFDAMTFALFGGGSGTAENLKNGRNSIEEWRCNQAQDNVKTYVSFTFSVNERKFRFMRGLEKKTKNFSPVYECGEIDEDGNVIPFFEQPKDKEMTAKAEELVGLTKEQFRQVVMLPQGQFEKFLTAKSEEKEAILQQIFSSSQWSKFASSFYAICLERKDTLEETRSEIIRSLSEDELSSLDDLQQLINDKNEAVDLLLKTHTEFDGPKKQTALQNDIKLAEKFEPLHELEKTQARLESKKSGIDIKRQKYVEAEKAETLRKPINEYEAAFDESKKRQDTLDGFKRKLPLAQQKKKDAEDKKNEHTLNSPVDELTKKIGAYEGKRDVYASIDEIRRIFKDAQIKLSDADKKQRLAEEEYRKAFENAKLGREKYEEAASTAKEYRIKYYNGIYGEIASELQDGEICPICGSTAHPSPAKKLPDSVSKNEVDAKDSETDAAKKRWDAFEAARTQSETSKNEADKKLSDAKINFTDAETKLKEAEKNLIDSVPNLASLNDAIQKANNSIKTYKETEKALQTALETADKELTALSENISTAEKEIGEAKEKENAAFSNLEKALKEGGFAKREDAKAKLLSDGERSTLHTEIVEYDTSVKENANELAKKKTELSGKQEPDTSKFTERQKEINDESEKFTRDTATLNTAIERLTRKLKDLSAKQAYYDKNFAEADTDLAFAKKLRGDTGIGLQRYVLAIMFNQVIGEANRMLEKVHGGRYHLYRTNDKGAGNKRGLELKVFDNRCPDKEGRSVSMLSGGEKFLVSLSLSIGMSTVAQKSGVRIEALFIDEGFGTLDDTSIQDAMEVLDSVRAGAGTIGIISHVQLLEANIPTHLNVIKSEAGSRISLE